MTGRQILRSFLVGFGVLGNNLAYKEYDMRLMLAPRSAKALHEKALLKLHRIRKLPGSPSFDGTFSPMFLLLLVVFLMRVVILSNGGSSVSDLDSEFSSTVIAINSSNSAKSFSSRMVPSMEWRISLPLIDVKDHSFSSNSEIELFLFDSNYCIGNVKKRVSIDNFAYKEYDMRLMLAPRSTKALQEKALLKFHRIMKLPGSPSFGGTLFWSMAELS
ncbi:hypothetical protein Tco_0110956 [Tanacetum coccineum]